MTLVVCDSAALRQAVGAVGAVARARDREAAVPAAPCESRAACAAG
jgi:hypothetical protein